MNIVNQQTSKYDKDVISKPTKLRLLKLASIPGLPHFFRYMRAWDRVVLLRYNSRVTSKENLKQIDHTNT